MPKTQASDPPVPLLLIHRAISRGLEVGSRYAESFSRGGYPDPATGAGFALYLKTLAGVLHQHHSAEDEIAFPFLRDKLPGLPIDDLLAEHEEMEEILGELAPSLHKLQGGAGEGPALDAACAALSRLAEIWPGHIDAEEIGVSTSKLVSIVGPEALGGWLAEMGQHRPQGAPPDPVGIPFVLYNLADRDRAIMAEQMPPAVVQELVPGPWKEHWAPMGPFLLD